MTTLSDLRALIIDMDGVLYRGNTAIPGAAAFLRWLRERHFPFVLLTNNSTLDPQAYEAKLAAMGISVPANQIVTSAVVTADYVARNFRPRARVYVIGESGLTGCLAARGLTLTDEQPEVVVVGMDRELTYDKLRIAGLAIRAGAAFIATNPDRTLPTEAGLIPGSGAIVAALEAATDQKAFIIGKPESPMLEMAIAQLGQGVAHTAAIGDRLETDILGGQNLGMPTILVLSGVTHAAPADGPVQPTFVFASVAALEAAWRRDLGQ